VKDASTSSKVCGLSCRSQTAHLATFFPDVVLQVILVVFPQENPLVELCLGNTNLVFIITPVVEGFKSIKKGKIKK
jgi:hypothetical protein